MAVTFKKVIHLIAYILSTRKGFVFGAILFRISLEIVYATFVSPVYGYTGFAWTPDILKYLESWIVYCFLIFWAPKKMNRISDLFLLIVFFNMIVPVLIFYSLADQSRSYLYTALLGYFLVLIFRQVMPVRFPVILEGRCIARIIVILSVLGISAWFFLSGGVQFFNLNLAKVYEYRDVAGEIIRAGPMAYLNTWTFFVFGPTLLTMALWRRAFFFAALVLLVHLFWFGVSAHKIVLFAPALVIFTWFWLQKTKSLSWIPLGLALVISSCLCIFFIFDRIRPASLFVRRVFFVPAMLTFKYYDFFSNNELIWWSNSKLTLGLLKYPYYINSAELIGKWVGSESHANNGFLASGYMHAGVLGVALYGLLVGFLFWLIDSITDKNIPQCIALGIVIIPIYSLIISSDLPTALLTKGIAVGILILFLMRHRGYDRVRRRK